MKNRKWIAAAAVVLVLLVAAIGIIKKKNQKEIVLEFGMFTGSNWDVASANCFVIMDKAIAAFEESHPGLKIHYDSGVLKEDYSEWCARKLLRGDLPDVFMVLGTDFNQFTSLGIIKNLENLIVQDQ